MGSDGETTATGFGLLDRDEVEGVLSGSFYTPRPKVQRPADSSPSAAAGGKPTHYKVICISMYTDDLKKLDAMVDALKSKGMTKASRSALIRHALGAVDIDKVPRGM